MDRGLHQCFDVPDREDTGQVRQPGVICLMAMLRRFSSRLLLESSSGPKKLQHQTTTDCLA